MKAFVSRAVRQAASLVARRLLRELGVVREVSSELRRHGSPPSGALDQATVMELRQQIARLQQTLQRLESRLDGRLEPGDEDGPDRRGYPIH